MRSSANHCELHVTEHHVDILLAPHLDVDRMTNALWECHEALNGVASAEWFSEDGGREWLLPFILDTPVALSLTEREAWELIEGERT